MENFSQRKSLLLVKTLLDESEYTPVLDELQGVEAVDELDSSIERRGIDVFWSCMKDEIVFDEDDDRKVGIPISFAYNFFEEIGYHKLCDLLKSISKKYYVDYDLFENHGISSAEEILMEIDNDSIMRSFVHAYLANSDLPSHLIDVIQYESDFVVDPDVFLNHVCPNILNQPKFFSQLLRDLGYQQVACAFESQKNTSLFDVELDLDPKLEISNFLDRKTLLLSLPIGHYDILRSAIYVPVGKVAVCEGLYTYTLSSSTKDGKPINKKCFRGFDHLGKTHEVEVFSRPRDRRNAQYSEHYLQGSFFQTFIHGYSYKAKDVFHLYVRGDGRYFIQMEEITPTPHLQDDLCLDSLDTENVTALEEDLEFESPDSEADKINSSGLAVDIITAHPKPK